MHGGSVQGVEQLDWEWVSLMLSARDIGLTVEQVRRFLDEKRDIMYDTLLARRIEPDAR